MIETHIVRYHAFPAVEWVCRLSNTGSSETPIIDDFLRPYFLGDIYPLLPLTTSQRDWYAYQLQRGDLGEGCVLVFRRPESPDAARIIRLERIDPNAQYSVSVTGETYELAAPTKTSGAALEEVEVRINTQPGSTLIRYKRL